jgi:hypothetical protein
MGEGVDPTEMCQSLMDKMRRSQQLMAAADPDLLVLFEDWLEALEDEVVSRVKETASQNPQDLARKLGLSQEGAAFLLGKLRKEGRL